MSERKQSSGSEDRVTPFLRTELSWLEGVGIDNGSKSVTVRALHDNQLAVVETVDGKIGKTDIFELPIGETYQHEIIDGKVFSLNGGQTRKLTGERIFKLFVPLDLKVVKLVHKAETGDN